MLANISYILMALGTCIFIIRLSPQLLDFIPGFGVPSDPGAGVQPFKKLPSVSIIIPVRNEEKNILGILSSMTQLTYKDYEVIVVDDNSTDNTVEIIRTIPMDKIRLVEAGEKPSSWIGKSWACHVGAGEAQGEYLLFTDADTVHYKKSLDRAISFMTKRNLDMISALPYHITEESWEELMGPFHMLVLAVTSPFTIPTPQRLFAIGQYLLLRREAYDKIGGHAEVKAELAEDIALARNILKADLSYLVYPEAKLYQVRMFDSIFNFFKGWRRLNAIGFGYSDWKTGIESFLMVAAFVNSFFMFESWVNVVTLLVLATFVSLNQRKYGNFLVFGSTLFLPFSILMFIATAIGGMVDRFITKKVEWRGRKYEFDDEKTTAARLE